MWPAIIVYTQPHLTHRETVKMTDSPPFLVDPSHPSRFNDLGSAATKFSAHSPTHQYPCLFRTAPRNIAMKWHKLRQVGFVDPQGFLSPLTL